MSNDMIIDQLPKLPFPVIDNHTHYDMVLESSELSLISALDDLSRIGVNYIIQVGCDVKSSKWSVWASKQDSRIYSAIALHPNEIVKLAKENKNIYHAFRIIEELAEKPSVVAIGETGLDFYRNDIESISIQELFFKKHIELAIKCKKTLQIHNRNAHNEIVDILNNLDEIPKKIVFHCFSGDKSFVDICNKNRWYMSFAGNTTFKNAKDIRDSIHFARKELILCETDSPFLTPHPYRGKTNNSSMISLVVHCIAKELGMDIEETCKLLYSNTLNAYNLKG